MANCSGLQKKASLGGSAFSGDWSAHEPKLLPLATDIVFDANFIKYEEGSVPAAGMIFTADTTGAILGSTAVLELIATGGTEPDFSAFRELNGSSGWDNRNGVLNLVVIYYFGPGSIWLTISQEDGVVPVPVDNIAPTLTTAVVANAAPNALVLTFSETLATRATPASSFAVSGNTVTGFAQSGATVTLTVGTPFAYGATAATVTYTPGANPLADAAGNAVAAISARAITNNVVSATAVPLTFATRTANVTESNGTYTNTTAVFWTETMLGDQKIPGDGIFSADLGTGGTTASMIGFNSSNVNQAYSSNNWEYYAFVNASTFFVGANSAAVSTSVPRQRYARLRRTENTVVLEASSNNTTWSLVYTFANISTGDLFLMGSFLGNGSLTGLTGVGVLDK